MRSLRKEHVEITLILSEREAKLLKAMVQNPIHSDETPAMRDFRQDLWEELHGHVTTD